MTTHEFIQKRPSVGLMGLYRIFQDNVVVRVVSPNSKLKIAEIDREVNHMLYAMNRESYYTIIDIRNILMTSKAARSWSKTDLSHKVVRSYAVVATTGFHAVLARISLSMNKLPMPNKMFRDFETALAWTLEIKAKQEHNELPNMAA